MTTPLSRATFTLLAASLLSLATSVTTHASSTGITGFARPESGACGNCHPSAIPPQILPLTQLLIVGLPEAGYVPGTDYPISVSVVGPLLPNAGFNLEVTAGGLRAEDDSARIEVETECSRMQNETGCVPGSVANECEVADDPGCPVYDGANPSCRLCPPQSDQCRPCDGETVLSVEATHSSPALVPTWNLVWTAPAEGAGEVRFYLAGNSVDGILATNDQFDFWNVLAEPVVVAPAQ